MILIGTVFLSHMLPVLTVPDSLSDFNFMDCKKLKPYEVLMVPKFLLEMLVVQQCGCN
jgi:hypothetical protein